LSSGTFNEAVTVDKAISFEGSGVGQTIMDGSSLSGSGLHLIGDLGSKEKVKISGITFQNYTAAGVDFDDDAVLKELKIEDSSFIANGLNGVRIGGDYDPVALQKIQIKDSSFDGNGNGSSNGDGDILLFQYYGDAKIDNVSINGSGFADNAIQIRGDDGPIGKVEIKDITIDGAYAKTGIAVYNYSDGNGLQFKDVEVNALTGWGLPVNVDGVGGKVEAKKLDASAAPGVVALQGDDGDNDLKAGDSSTLLNGKGGDDKLKGGDADDFIIGGGGNDKIDGGKGDDVAIYYGSIDDYLITNKSHDKIKVTDLVSGFEGTDELKKVELLQFQNGTPNDVSDDVYFNTDLGTELRLDTSVDTSAQTATGNLPVGSGIPATDFVTVDNNELGLELGLQIIYRQGPSVDPVSVSGDGTVHFVVNDGPQSTDNFSSGNNSGRAAWSFEYSIATGTGGEPTDLSDFTFRLKVDVDPSGDTDFREFTMVEIPAGNPFVNATGFVWIDQDGNPVILDDGGNANVAQNSENFAFGFIENFIDADPNTPGIQSYAGAGFSEGQFDIVLEAYDAEVGLVASNHIVVDVFDLV